jgi:anti-anti-sigma factor
MAEVAANALFLEVSRGDSMAVVRCRGRLVMGLHDQLYVTVKELIPSSTRIVLDCTDLVRMDSMGLGTVVRLYVSAKSSGCALVLKNIGPPIRQLLGITNLLDALVIIGENNIKMGP